MKFLTTIAISALLTSAIIVGFNVLVNPYSYFFDAKRNEKPLSFSKHRNLKIKDILQTDQLEAAIVGSSRVLSGFSKKEVEEIVGPSTYNCGVSGANFEEIYQFAKLLIKTQPHLSKLVVGLDFFGFNEYYVDQDFNSSRFKHPNFYFPDWISFAFSLKAMKDSVKTVTGIFPATTTIDEMGYLPFGVANIEIDMAKAKAAGAEREKTEQWYMRHYFQNSDTHTVYQKYKLSEKAIESFRKLVHLCRKNQIDLKVYITPTHYVYLQSLRLKGYWPLLEQFKKELVQIHPIWDFSGKNYFNSSGFLADYSLWFYDLNHANTYIGKEMLNRMFGKGGEIGVLLTSENVDEQLRGIKEDQLHWANENPKTMSWVIENGKLE